MTALAVHAPIATVLHGDCLVVLKSLPDNSVDSIVTDPPAGISFMGKEWDGHKGGRDTWIAWLTDVLQEAMRVLKPGGHALVWALPRTSHWTATACEDAGFEVRDRLQHWFGSGFPKGHDIGKAIDKAAGAEREVVGLGASGSTAGMQSLGPSGIRGGLFDVTAPATPEAAQWDGWNTALKPSCEDWHLCRKPLSERTVAANVLRWGTGALNIGAARVGTEPRAMTVKEVGFGENFMDDGWQPSGRAYDKAVTGRWPAHLLLSHGEGCVEVGTRKVKGGAGTHCNNRDADGHCRGHDNAERSTSGATVHGPDTGDPDGTETIPAWTCEPGCVVAELDAQSGVSKSTRALMSAGPESSGWGLHTREPGVRGHDDAGGASRFFATFRYQAKAPAKERPVAPDGTRHATVKPLELTRWLVRLVTPPGGVVLDMFAGSGTTLEAALQEGCSAIGIEAEASYLPLISARLARAPLP